MAWTTPPVWVVGAVLTAAQMNTYVTDDLNDLHRRTNPSTQTVATSQTTTSGTFTDLATAGPAVTVTTGTMALVALRCQMSNSGASASVMGFAVSGATTVAASLEDAISNVGTNEVRIGASFLVTGLTAGSNTFTAKYMVGGGTSTFSGRDIIVIPLGAA